jgi:hypothetical protein
VCFYESDEDDGDTWLCSSVDPLCAGLGLLIGMRDSNAATCIKQSAFLRF